MIVVDTSALMAILLTEDDCSGFATKMEQSDEIVIGAPTKLEFLMVAEGRRPKGGINAAMALLATQGIVTVAWTEEHADVAADAFLRFGKGQHPAKLNFGDCMAYAVAKAMDAPLLYKGDDFALTDIRSAI